MLGQPSVSSQETIIIIMNKSILSSRNRYLSSSNIRKLLWNGSVRFDCVSDAWRCVDNVSARLDMTRRLRVLFERVYTESRDELALVCAYSSSRPLSEPTQRLGVGGKLVQHCVATASDTDVTYVSDLLEIYGDIGEVARKCLEDADGTSQSSVQAEPLCLRHLDATLRSVRDTTGKDAQSTKVKLLSGLLRQCEPGDALFLARLLNGNLRIGVKETTVLEALALLRIEMRRKEALDLDISENRRELSEESGRLRALYSKNPSFVELVASGAFADATTAHAASQTTSTASFQMGRAVRPMLARSGRSVEQMSAAICAEPERYVLERKYDGVRAQVHVWSGGEYVRVFSRSLEDMTERYADVVDAMRRVCRHSSLRSFVLDVELVAVDRASRTLLPMQLLTRRKHTHDATDSAVPSDVCAMAFDLLAVDERSLLDAPLSERRALLRESLSPIVGEFEHVVSHENVRTHEELLARFHEALASRCEGLMVKRLDARYEAARRASHWTKLKVEHVDDGALADTFDLVPIGANYGRGRRSLRFGSFLMACRGSAGAWYGVCNVGTGFTDDALERLYAQLWPHRLEERPREYVSAHTPDVWLNAQSVWELGAASVTRNVSFDAADPRSLSLRFPRFVRVRDDKQVTEATGIDELRAKSSDSVPVTGSD